MPKDGGLAFPTAGYSAGLTLREYAAVAAMNGLLAGNTAAEFFNFAIEEAKKAGISLDPNRLYAQFAVRQADALITELAATSKAQK